MKRRDVLAALCAAASMPAALAQQAGRVYHLGFMVQRPVPWLLDPLLATLRGRGWVPGRNLQVEARYPGGDTQRAYEDAKELAARQVDAIVVVGTHFALAAKRATETVPIVMYLSGYPVEGGLVKSYARPGGNVTGLVTYGGEVFFTKIMGLIAEMLPSLRELGVMWDYLPPAFLEKESELTIGELRRAAAQANIRTRVWMIKNEADLGTALPQIAAARVGAIFASGGPVHGLQGNVERINEFALHRRLPLICDIAGSLFRGGGLFSYSASWQEAAERCGSFVDRILRGAKPGELPIERPTKFELIINRKTANAIGLAIPPAMLLQADRVIE